MEFRKKISDAKLLIQVTSLKVSSYKYEFGGQDHFNYITVLSLLLYQEVYIK